MLKQTNRFLKINGDKSLAEMSTDSVRESVNLSFTSDGNVGSASKMKGTLLLENFLSNIGNFNVLGAVKSYGNVDSSCSGTFVKREGIVYFIYDGNNGASIKFFDAVDEQLYTLFPAPNTTNNNELGFNDALIIDAISISDNGCHFVYFVDGENNYRRIEVKVSGQACMTYPNFRELNARPVDPIDPIVFDSQVNNGFVLAGSYQFLYRRWNSKTCVYSGWSCTTNPIPVIPDEEGCTTTNGRYVWGGRVGSPTNKKIILKIPTVVGAEGFDQVQLLVIENTAGVKTDASKGKLLVPQVYDPAGISFTGLEKGIDVELSDVFIDDLPVIGAGTITEKDNKIFLGNINLQGFDFDNPEGTPADISIAKTILKSVGNSNQDDVYKCETDTVENKGHFRGETYAYGALVKDDFGNGVVCPFDLSVFKSSFLIQEEVATGNVESLSNGVFLMNVSDTSVFKVGDWFTINSSTDIGIVAEILSPTQMNAIGEIEVGDQGDLNLLLGQSGNQGAGWAWKYPERCQNQFSIFNENNEIQAIGLRVEGIKNFPSWAKSFEIVRRKRIRDIIYQTPHIPGIAVQGSATVGQIGFTAGGDSRGWVYDYQGELDHVAPKVHQLGTARNLVRRSTDYLNVTSPFDFSEWERQRSDAGFGEVSSLIFAIPPEYIYNHDQGNAFRLEDTTGAIVDIADAVSWQGFLDLVGNAERIDEENRKVFVFKAKDRTRYFFNREGYVVENGNKSYQKKITELVGFDDYIISNNSKVDYQLESSLSSPKITFPKRTFTSGELVNISLYGATGELAAQQGGTDEVVSKITELFWPSVNNQRGLLIKTDKPLQDFSYMLHERRVAHNDNYFPLLTWEANENIYQDDNVTSEDFTVFPLDSRKARSLNNPVTPLFSGEFGGAYILNIRKGLGDDRYGNINETSGEWIRTGICQVLNQEDLDNNTSFDVDIFGGDCFISKAVIKISESVPRVVEYDPLDEAIGTNQNDDIDIDVWSKTGAFEKNVEILELYLESEVNTAYANLTDQYPNLPSAEGALGDWEHYYHPNYSNQNSNKVFVTKPNFCKLIDQLRNTVVWSDTRVRGGNSNPFIDIEGFNRFRINNQWVLDAKFGNVIKIDTLEDKSLHIFQERKIAFQPIGVDEIQTLDGSLIATGTGTVLGSGDYYLQVDVGTQHLKTIKSRDGRFYGVDQDRRVVYSFGSRGSGFELISENGMISYFREYLSSKFNSSALMAHIDEKFERYIVHHSSRELKVESPVYNIKLKDWETVFYTNNISNGISQLNSLFWMSAGKLYKMYEGDYNSFFEVIEASKLSIVVNYDPTLTKIFQVIIINSLNRIGKINCVVFNENQLLPHQNTGLLNTNQPPKNEQYFFNKLVAKVGGRSRKLRGKTMIVNIELSNSINNTVIDNIVTEMRKSY